MDLGDIVAMRLALSNFGKFWDRGSRRALKLQGTLLELRGGFWGDNIVGDS